MSCISIFFSLFDLSNFFCRCCYYSSKFSYFMSGEVKLCLSILPRCEPSFELPFIAFWFFETCFFSAYSYRTWYNLMTYLKNVAVLESWISMNLLKHCSVNANWFERSDSTDLFSSKDLFFFSSCSWSFSDNWICLFYSFNICFALETWAS